MNTAPEQRELRSVPAAEARALLKQQGTSNMNIAAFARARGVHPWSLYNARSNERRKKQGAATHRFAQVAVTDEPDTPASETSIAITLPSGLSLQVDAGFGEVTLRRLLGVLASC